MSPAESGRRRLRSSAPRKIKNRAFVVVCVTTSLVALVILAALLTAILVQGLPGLRAHFLTSAPSPDAAEAGIRPALFGTIWLCSVCGLLALPIGVGTAIVLEEFKPRHHLLVKLHGFVQLNISNLAGVPSVVYGILGLTAFASMFGLFGPSSEPFWEIGVRHYDQFLSENGERPLFIPVTGRDAPPTAVAPGMTALNGRRELIQVNVIAADAPAPKDEATLGRTLRVDAESGRRSIRSWYYFQLPFGRGVLAGGLTLMLVILPIVIISSQEALRAVPNSLREAALGMGATPWQVVWNVTLPASVPGIMTGAILSMSRAIGEAAPILIICGVVYISNSPAHLMDDFTVMPLQIYNWMQEHQKEFHSLAATGIVVLLMVLLTFNALAVFIRHKLQKPLT